jgi:hypothetical protein
MINGGHALMRYSENNGTNWKPSLLMDPTMRNGGWMLYSGSTMVDHGVNFIAISQEFGDAGDSPGSARIYFTYSAEAGGTTPYGTVPTDTQAANNDSDDLVFGTNFDQIDGLVEQPWSAVILNGVGTTANVTDGEMHPAVLNQTPGTICRVHLKNIADLRIETEMYTTTGSGTAAGIVFRMVNSGSFLAFIVEDTNVRLYKYASGAATALATVANNHQYNAWVKLRVVTTGVLTYCYYNEWPLIKYELTGGDHTIYRFGYFHGVKLLPQAGSLNNHRVRYWRAWWSNRINT